MPVVADFAATVPPFSYCRDHLLDQVLPAAPGTIVQLDLGTNLLFAGCGRGETLVELARQFPRSRFLGTERAPEALAATQQAAQAAGLQNLQLGRPDTVRRAHFQGIFHYVIRQGGEAGAPTNSLPALLRDGGLLFDLGKELPSVTDYHDAGLIIIRTLRLPSGCRAVIAGNWPLPAPRT